MVETPQLWLLSSNRLQSSRQPYRKQGVDHPTGSRLDICKLGICLRTIGVCDQHQRYQAARGSGLPDSLHYENGLAVANGNYVLLHGRFTGIACRRTGSWRLSAFGGLRRALNASGCEI
jgi:hypothetical protein